MAINPDAGRVQGSLSQVSFQQHREVRQAQLEAKIQEATLTPAQQLSPQEIRAHQSFYNKTIEDVDSVRCGNIGGLGGLTEGFINKCFPFDDAARRVDKATDPNFFDNKDASSLRDEYGKAFQEARRERSRAVREVDKLGPGEHTLSNGDKVEVTVDPKTGQETVKTTSPDGTTKTVSFNSKDPDAVSVSRTDKDGRTETLEADGTTVTKSETNLKGQTTSNRYSLDHHGRPVREKTGPGGEDYTKTVANPDGSTDTRNLIYRDERGRPVYEDKHQDPGWRLMPHPEPHPHPGPHPHPHPHPGPFPPGPPLPPFPPEPPLPPFPPGPPLPPFPPVPGPIDPLPTPKPVDPKDVDEATKPRPNDNKDAKEVRDEYRKAADEARHERSRAEQEAKKLGPGQHTLSNGDKVDVTVNPKTGETVVKTTRPDGSTSSVSFNEKDPDSVKVQRTHPDGSHESLSQDGATITRRKTDANGETISNRYHLDSEGLPVRDRSGPGKDDLTKVRANPDGSADVRNLIYRDDEGHPVYEDKHEKPAHHHQPPFPIDLPELPPFVPDPWDPAPCPLPHPWPTPEPLPEPWEPVPWWRIPHPPTLFGA